MIDVINQKIEQHQKLITEPAQRKIKRWKMSPGVCMKNERNIPVNGTGCRHATSETLNAVLLKVRNMVGLGRDHRQRIRRSHEESVFAQNHIAILKTDAERK